MSSSGTITRPTPPPVSQASEAVARWVWPGLIIGLLGTQVAMGAYAVVLATGDPAWRVVPHYHDRAMNWDKVAKARAASDQLGWTTTIQPGPSADLQGQRELTVDLADRAGRPLADTTVQVELWHHAYPGEVQSVTCRAVSGEPGRYRGRGRLTRSGMWEVELSAQQGNDRWLFIQPTHWSF
jgi:nitrogen fixation protein FixH